MIVNQILVNYNRTMLTKPNKSAIIIIIIFANRSVCVCVRTFDPFFSADSKFSRRQYRSIANNFAKGSRRKETLCEFI